MLVTAYASVFVLKASEWVALEEHTSWAYIRLHTLTSEQVLPLTHSLTHSWSHSLSHLLMQYRTYSPIVALAKSHCCTLSFTHSLAISLSHCLTHSLTLTLTHFFCWHGDCDCECVSRFLKLCTMLLQDVTSLFLTISTKKSFEPSQVSRSRFPCHP
jgi:hypothetical protein